MISLNTRQFPSSKNELAQALENAIRRFAQKTGPIVTVRSASFPHFDEITVNLDGVHLDSSFPAPPRIEAETEPACGATVVTLSARNISVRGVPMDLRMEAHDVVFYKGQDENGEAVLIFRGARDGTLTLSATQLDLEEAIAKIGGGEARRHGITIDQVRLAIHARSARSVAADVRIRARKFLLRASIGVHVQLDVGDDLVAKVSQLKCRGEGAIGSLVCGALERYLGQLDGQTFPLNSLPFGEIQLRDLRVAVADSVEVVADFGSAVS
jgi:hypothetical protein